jgi:YVTN family beta-propeller protein
MMSRVYNSSALEEQQNDYSVEPLSLDNIEGYGDELPVGDFPLGLAFNREENILYVANRLSNTVSVVNTLENKKIDDIEVGLGPTALSFDSQEERLYVANCDDNTVSVVNTLENKKIDDIEVGEGHCPWSIASDPKLDILYVANSISQTVSIFNSSRSELSEERYKLLEERKVGCCPSDIVINPNNNLVYVTLELSNSTYVLSPQFSSDGKVSFINPKNITEQNRFVATHPVDVAIDPDKGAAYVANWNSSALWLIEEGAFGNGTCKCEVFDLAYVPFPNNVEVDPNSDIVYVLGGLWDRSIISNSSGFGYPYELYMINASETAPRPELLSGWDKYASQLSDLEIDSNSGTLYIANTASNSLKIIPLNELVPSNTAQDTDVLRLGNRSNPDTAISE